MYLLLIHLPLFISNKTFVSFLPVLHIPFFYFHPLHLHGRIAREIRKNGPNRLAGACRSATTLRGSIHKPREVTEVASRWNFEAKNVVLINVNILRISSLKVLDT